MPAEHVNFLLERLLQSLEYKEKQRVEVISCSHVKPRVVFAVCGDNDLHSPSARAVFRKFLKVSCDLHAWLWVSPASRRLMDKKINMELDRLRLRFKLKEHDQKAPAWRKKDPLILRQQTDVHVFWILFGNVGEEENLISLVHNSRKFIVVEAAAGLSQQLAEVCTPPESAEKLNSFRDLLQQFSHFEMDQLEEILETQIIVVPYDGGAGAIETVLREINAETFSCELALSHNLLHVARSIVEGNAQRGGTSFPREVRNMSIKALAKNKVDFFHVADSSKLVTFDRDYFEDLLAEFQKDVDYGPLYEERGMNVFLENIIEKHLDAKRVDLAYLQLLLCCALVNRSDQTLLYFYRRCRWPMFAALSVVCVAEEARQRCTRLNEDVMRERFTELKATFENRAIALLQKCYRRSEICTRAILTKPRSVDSHDNPQAPNYMDLAYTGKATRFLSQKVCQLEIESEWGKSGPERLSWLWFLPAAFLIFPPICKLLSIILRSRRSVERASSGKPDSFCHRLLRAQTSPLAKFIVHTMAYIIYDILFAYVMVAQGRQAFFQECPASELILLLWWLDFIIESLLLIYELGIATWYRVATADFYYDVFILVCFFWRFLAFAMLNSHAGAYIRGFTMLTYLGTFIYGVLRIMRLFFFSNFFGPIVLLFIKMTKQLLFFFLLFVIFWLAFAVSMLSITGYHEDGSRYPWKIFEFGAFEIFGEPRDEHVEGVTRECSKDFRFNFENATSQSVECLFRTTAVPLLLFSFLLFASLLLVNLLTAHLSSVFDSTDKEAIESWSYTKYKRLKEYRARSSVPPPFTLVAICGRLLRTCCFNESNDEDSRRRQHTVESLENGTEMQKLNGDVAKQELVRTFTDRDLETLERMYVEKHLESI